MVSLISHAHFFLTVYRFGIEMDAFLLYLQVNHNPTNWHIIHTRFLEGRERGLKRKTPCKNLWTSNPWRFSKLVQTCVCIRLEWVSFLHIFLFVSVSVLKDECMWIYAVCAFFFHWLKHVVLHFSSAFTFYAHFLKIVYILKNILMWVIPYAWKCVNVSLHRICFVPGGVNWNNSG